MLYHPNRHYISTMTKVDFVGFCRVRPDQRVDVINPNQNCNPYYLFQIDKGLIADDLYEPLQYGLDTGYIVTDLVRYWFRAILWMNSHPETYYYLCSPHGWRLLQADLTTFRNCIIGVT